MRRRQGKASRWKAKARARGKQLALPNRERHPGELAWEKHVPLLGGPPVEWLDVVEELVRKHRPVDPDGMRALALLVLRLAGRTWASFREGRWIQHVTSHVYIHFDGRGWGVARPLRLVAKLVELAAERGVVSRWERTRLLSEVEEARACVGLPSAGEARVADRAVAPVELGALGAAVASSLPPGPARAVAAEAVAIVAGLLAPHGGCVHFGDLEPELLEADAVSVTVLEEPPGARAAREAFPALVLEVACALYAELARRGWLERDRAEEIVARLVALGARRRAGTAAA